MCRLLGIKQQNNNKDLSIILAKFRAQSKFGKVPKGIEGGHKDGWGFVLYNKNGVSLFKRSYMNAYNDNGYKAIKNSILNSTNSILIGHLRKSSVGKKCIENSHPFVYKNFSFCQNGTILNSEKIITKSKYKSFIKGDTDSEKLFYFILGMTGEKITKTKIIKVIEKIRENFDYTSMNILLSDGKSLFALRDINLNNSTVKKLKMENYYSLFLGENTQEKYKVISSEKIKIKGIKWKLIKNKEIIEVT